MAHDRVAGNGESMHVTGCDTCFFAQRSHGPVDAFLERAVDLVRARGHGVMHAREDVASEGDLGVLEAQGEDVLLRDIVVEEEDEIGGAEVEGERVRAFAPNVDEFITVVRAAYDARESAPLFFDLRRDFSQDRQRDREQRKPERVFNALVVGPPVVVRRQRECYLFFYNQLGH